MVVWLEIETLVIDKCGTRRGADGKVGVGRVIWAAGFCVLCISVYFHCCSGECFSLDIAGGLGCAQLILYASQKVVSV
jgi:hypothetical protein